MSDDFRDQIDCFFDQRILQSYGDLQQILFTSLRGRHPIAAKRNRE